MFQRFKNFRKLRKWYVVKLKLVDARLYFVSIFVGLLTGLVCSHHYCLYYFFNLRSEFLLPPSGTGIFLFSFLLGGTDIRIWLVMKMPLITGGGFLKHVLPSTGALLISILS